MARPSRRRPRRLLTLGALCALLGAPAAHAQAPDDVTASVLRTLCDQQWVERACAATGYPEPQYRSDADPSPGAPLVQLVGVVHEHSGFSDNDVTDTTPADYYEAARTGHNTGDDGDDTGVIVDFLLSSEHSENEKLPITTAAACVDPAGIPDAVAVLELEGAVPPLACDHVLDADDDQYAKWTATLRMAIDGSEVDEAGRYVGFTAMRGFEYTNDYYNHLGVYFSRNVVNAKIDGSFVSTEVFWDWLREPAEEGGGSDALVVFNHPGGYPSLSPFDGDLPHNQLLATVPGGGNWHDLEYVPDVDDLVAGIEVNGGDDLSWYVKALTNGWHLGPVAAEDEHQLEWSSSGDGKTLLLTRGRSPRDHYFALRHHRSVALGEALVGGAPGTRAVVPTILLWAGPADVQDPAATLLGDVRVGAGEQALHLSTSGLPAGALVTLVSGALDAPLVLGAAGPDGALDATASITPPAVGEHWYFAVVCPAGATACGADESYLAVTAPVWFRSAAAAVPAGTPPPAAAAPSAGGAGGSALPATGTGVPLAVAALAVALALGVRVRSDVSRG